ncbi:restriction endonuclease subunit S [Vibrio casei]|uniref:restriction endonuclease subunit S n=1 Tax=Vibrio casei TaxID=673372 RepID=UPI000B5C8EC3|nr:restriction endonuclease subunit S [Vibrio casei]
MSNVVPEGWAEFRLGDLTDVITKGTTPKSYTENGVNFVKVESVSNSATLLPSKFSYIDAETNEKFKRSQLNDGDILFSIAGSLGRLALVEKRHLPANTNQALAIIRLQKDVINTSFCIQYLKSNQIQLELMKLQTVGAQPNLSLQQVSDIYLKVPKEPEQKKIAAILTSVDEVIEKTQAQIDKLKDLKTAMMQELLTCGVGVDGKPHTEFKDSPVGRIPKGWEVKSLDTVVKCVVDCEHKTAPYVEQSEFMVVRTSNVRDGELVFDDMKFTHSDGFNEWTKRTVPTKGDVLFTREAPAGESCLVPDNLKVCMGQRMVLLRPDNDVVESDFFSMFLTSEVAKKSIFEMSIGTTVSRINIEDIKKIPCVVPPKIEQIKIANSISCVQNLLSTKQGKLESLNLIKKALMQDLLTGKVRVKVD